MIEVQSSVDTAEIYIGDLVTYSIVIKHDKELRIEQPREGLHLGAFEIKEYNFAEPTEEDGIRILRYDFTISVFDTGKYTIPPFPIAYFPDTTQQYKIIEAAAIDIYVKSVLSGDEAPQLKDIKPPIDIPFDYIFLYSILAIALIIVIALYMGYKAWKKKQEKGYIFVAPPKPRPAHEIALKELKELFASDLLERQQFKIFYSRLSEILRKYLEDRYYILALEETTFEILNDLKKHLKDEHHQMLAKILEQADLVKFAKHKPDEITINVNKENSVHFIKQTKLIFTDEQEMEEQQKTEKLLPLEPIETK
jgi:uncharacterized protein YqgQ